MTLKKIIYSLILVFILQVVNAQRDYAIKKLPFCSETENETSPVFYKGGIVFCSDKPSTSAIETTNQNDEYPFTFYFAEKKNKRWGKPQLFSKALKSNYNESSASFSADLGTIYFTREQVSVDQKGDRLNTEIPKKGIFTSIYTVNDWAPPKPFNVNNETYDIISPSLSADGAKLFFASRAPGGYGGYDIYFSNYEGGSWQQPENMGPNINTDTNEVFPFIHQNGRLYFASRGHPGRGGLDIFYTEMISGEWVNPINLPLPINSRQDDFGYIVNAEMDTGYFTSTRSGSYDIFMFSSKIPSFPDCPMQVEETFCYKLSESGSMDLDTTSLKYEWDFGDGTKVRGLTASHCYAEPGLYLVALNVIDTLTNDIYFSEATYNLMVERLEQPYILTPDTAIVDEVLTFNGEESNIKSFVVDNYFWDFGDGKIGKKVEVKHSFTKHGSYFVKLGLVGKNKLDPTKTEKACAQKEIIILRKQ